MHFQGNVFQSLKEKKVLDKDGKVDALGPYGKSKLTGMEVNAYFKKNKVKDPKVKKAVEVALDLSGAQSVATKEIAKFYGSKILKSKEVQKALKFANESFVDFEVSELSEELLNEKNLMPAIQKIVSDKQAQKVGGVMLDMFTASMISKVYDKVNDSNKAKMEKANINVLVKLAHKVMGMKEEVISEKQLHHSGQISKIFKTKDMKEIDGIANLMNMTSLKVLQSMQKQNPKGFKRMAAKMGELPAMEQVEEAVLRHDFNSRPNPEMMKKAAMDKVKQLNLKVVKPKDPKKGKDELMFQGSMTNLKKLQKLFMGESLEEGAVSAAQRAAIAISKKEKAGKPGYDKEGKSLKNKKEETIKEGTWKIPQSANELAMLADMLSKPFPATKPADVDKFMNRIPVGDDMLYDDLDAISYEKTGKMDRDGYPELKRPLVKMKKFPKVFVNVIAGEALQKEKWIRGKTSGNKFIMTHHSFGPLGRVGGEREESVDEKVMRKKGNIKRAKMMKLDMSFDKKQSVMDAYRQMWEDALNEEVANITVDPKNRISKSDDQNKHAMEINKQAKRFGLKSSMIGKHLRVKGPKKKVNDFLRIIIGKSTYGDPTEKDMSTPQIDKMLTKGLK